MAATNDLLRASPRPNSVLSNDDDDDVIMGGGRAGTPQQPVKRMPSDLSAKPQGYGGQPSPSQPSIGGQPLQRNDSKMSIPSRPPSAADQHSKSPSPDILASAAAGTKNGVADYRGENLPKIPENGVQQLQQQRPPSVTFRDDLQESRSSDAAKYMGGGGGGNKGMMMMGGGGGSGDGSGGQHQERMSTPTSEKFRTSPLHHRTEILSHERPANFDSGYKSSLKFSKNTWPKYK